MNLREMTLFTLDLHQFDGGAAGGAGAAAGGGDGAGGAEAAGASAQGGSQADTHGSTRRGKSGEYDNVLFGKQAARHEQAQAAAAANDGAGGQNAGSDTRKGDGEEFRSLIKGKYKAAFGEEVQRIINQRFSTTKTLEENAARVQPVLDAIAQRYGVEATNIDGIMSALNNDNAYWEQAADEAGMDVDSFRRMKDMERQLSTLQAQQQRQQAADKANQQAEKWYQEAQAVKAKFPSFDLIAELDDPAFAGMLRSGVPVEHAYKVCHLDNIVANAVSVTQKQTESNVTNNIRARGNRPPENAISSQGTFTTKSDVKKLTKNDRAEIVRRVKRGEHIEF